MNIVIGRGNARKVFEVPVQREQRWDMARTINRFLFPSHGAYQKAKRRAEAAKRANSAR